MNNDLAWHWTDGNKLRDGRPVPEVGVELRHDGPVKMCASGLHSSRTILAALEYAPGCMLHRVRVAEIVEEEDDKLVFRSRTILASADMTWALVEFSESCAVRAAAVRALAEAWLAAREAAWAAREAAVAAWAAREAAVEAREKTREEERAWQEETLRLWFECLSNRRTNE